MEEFHTSIETWFQSQHGHRVIQQFQEQLRPLSSTIKGEQILQLGFTNSTSLFSKLSYTHKWILSSKPVSKDNNVIRASYDFIPFSNESLNALIIPLSFCDRSFQEWPLDEIDRVLGSMGYVIFFVVNPISLWGLGMHFRKLSFIGKKVSHLPSLLQLKRAMLRRGYQHYHVNYFYYQPPVKRNVNINRFRVIEQMGDLFPPWPAAFYMLVMKKTNNIISPDVVAPCFQQKLFTTS